MPSQLTDLIHIIPPDRTDDPEDIFAFAPGLIFTDDLRNQHGDAGSVIVYKSNRFGDIELTTCDPVAENDRTLFSHYLWNAGIKMAEMVSDPDGPWSVVGERVLELGAGVGLGGIIAALANAQEVVISDYPSPVVLATVTTNARKAIGDPRTHRYRVQGHEWGRTDSEFAVSDAHSFTRILAADCYWMPGQHANLVQSMLHFLAQGPQSKVFCTAGFHTGRAKLADFFRVAVDHGLKVDDIYEEDADGVRREWLEERDGGFEDHAERKKWLVIATLSRA